MRSSSLAILLAGTALVALPFVALAEGEGPAPESAANGGAVSDLSPVRQLALAHELFALGKAQGDTLMVLAAARMAAAVAILPGPEFKRSESGTATAELPAEPLPGPAEPAAMFDLAASLAADDPLLAELVEDARAETGRGTIGGAVARRETLSPGRTTTWEIAFEGRAAAEISVIGSGASNLDFIVTDENGVVLCAEEGAGDHIYCDFYPAMDGFFFLAVENRGPEGNTYQLTTNPPRGG